MIALDMDGYRQLPRTEQSRVNEWARAQRYRSIREVTLTDEGGRRGDISVLVKGADGRVLVGEHSQPVTETVPDVEFTAPFPVDVLAHLPRW